MKHPDLNARGIVLGVRDSDISVEVHPPEECSGCGGCPAGEKRLITISSDLDISPGDELILTLNSGMLSKLSFIIYFLPAVFLICGFIAGYYIYGDIGGFSGAFISLLITYCIIRGFLTEKLNDPVRIKTLGKG